MGYFETNLERPLEQKDITVSQKDRNRGYIEIMSSTEAPDPIFRRRWPIIITFFIFASNNAFQYVEIWFQS